ncbi:MAG: CHAT domain-containing protein, partial [Cyclobacteriaceae bacterium]|nr:CHAT domain-containing protein [Cyclobacteriaceae bacterium]
EAEDIYKESFYNIFDKEITPLHPEYTTILNHIALLYEYKDNYKAAGSILQEAAEVSLKKFRDLEDIEYGKELEKIASLQIRMSDYENGKKNLEEAIRIYDLHKLKNDNLNSIYYIQALETKARLMAIEGYFDEAEDLIKEANSVYENTESTEGYNQLETTNDLVGINIFVGHLEEAKKSIEALIPKYEQVYGNNSGKLVSVLINKGRLDLLLGEYSEAEKAARRAYNISINVFGVQSTRSSQVSLLLSELYNTIGDYEKGIENADDALEIARDRFDERSLPVAMALSQLGLARFYNGEDLKETEAILLEAASIIEDKLSATNPRYAEISTYLARVYIQSNKFAEAFNNLSRAEKIWLGITGKRGGRKNINVGRIYVLTGDVYYQQKNYSKAEEEYNKARDVYNRSLSKDHPEYVKVLSKLSRVKYMEGDVQKAKDLLETALASYDLFIKRYFKTLSEREKAKFWFTIKPDYELYNMMALQFLDSDPNALNRMYNNVLTTKALLLNSSVKIRERILSSPDEVLKQKFIAWLEKKEFLTKVLAMGEEEIIENEINPARLSQEIEQLERELSEQSEMFSNDLEESQVTWENVRSTLKKNEVAIEMVRLRYFDHVFTDSIIYAAIYVKNEGDFPKPKVILLKNGDQMEGRYLRAYKNIMINRMGMDPYSYEQFWKPIIEEVGQLSTVYFSPDGVYNQLNLETISLGEGKYVIDNSRIVLVSNTKDLYMHAKKSRKEENEDDIALMFGNPDYYMEASSSNRISPLPGTENEVMQIRALLNEKGVTSDYFTKDEATEEQVKATINPNVLHIATHGFFNPEGKNSRGNSPEEAAAMSNPLLRAGLILSGGGDLMDKTSFNFNIESGILTAQEAMNLNLDKTELVVLSACETASGEVEAGEGVYGLQRAFIVAGAKTLIVSMFKVDDVATQKLMSIFYRKWLQTGKKRESFIEAKKEVRNEFKDPVDWGAFVMVGLD